MTNDLKQVGKAHVGGPREANQQHRRKKIIKIDEKVSIVDSELPV